MSSSPPSSNHPIHDLRHLSPPSDSLLSQLRTSLGGKEWIGEVGSEWRYQKSLPTMLLYSEEGLRLYEKITLDCPSYYLYPLELSLLQKHSNEIVSQLFPLQPTSADEDDTSKKDQQHARRPPVARWRVGDWGGETVGKHNGGVNGEEGYDNSGGGRGRREDEMHRDASINEKRAGSGQLEGVVLELGAGSLGKTSHLLKALASRPSVTNKSSSSTPPSIVSYLALDLDGNELERTLSDVDATLRPELEKGGVQTGGVWGTFDAGLEWCRSGGLLESFNGSTPSSDQRSSSCETKRSTCSSSDDHDNSSTMSSSPPQGLEPSLPPSPPSSLPNPSYTHRAASPPTAKGPSSSSSSASTDSTPPTHFLFLGSSLGNFPREAAPSFLKSLPLRPGSGDTLLLGLDHRNDPKTIERAYNDEAGVTKKWANEMWRGVERLTGKSEGELGDEWEYTGRYNVKEGRHEAYFRAKEDTKLVVPAGEGEEEMVVQFVEGELLNIEWSTKYSYAESSTLFAQSNLRVISEYTDPANPLYSLWLLERPPFQFDSITPVVSVAVSSPSPLNEISLSSRVGVDRGKYGTPSVQEWETLWSFWDTITLGMVSEEMLHQKPIDLRHKNLFYLGHIPAFLDIFLSKFMKEKHTEPEHFKDIFERGIDPNVDDPTQIHSHSATPEKDEDWPVLSEILQFRDRVRQRLLSIYDDVASGKREMTRRLGRVLFMTYEHEAMHAETLLYMLLQSPSTLPPSGFAAPDFSHLSTLWSAQQQRDAHEPSTITFGPLTIDLGHHDLEAEDEEAGGEWGGGVGHEFGWDNEHGRTRVEVGKVTFERKGVTNGEYREFLQKNGGKTIPGSWIETDGDIKVKTLYGPIDFSLAQHWPLMASYDELNAFAKSKGGRLPSESELRAWLDVVEEGDRVDWEGSNVGVKNWHPVPAQLSHVGSNGKVIPGHNGGVWEWTSTAFDGFPSFVTSELYPGYSTDFFDDSHQVVLGGSFATIPRIASRRTIRNFYQHNYPFAWVGGRVVYDA